MWLGARPIYLVLIIYFGQKLPTIHRVVKKLLELYGFSFALLLSPSGSLRLYSDLNATAFTLCVPTTVTFASRMDY